MEETEYTTLTLDGKTFQLVYDFDSICKAEEITGMELLFGVDFSRINGLRMRAMLLAMMLKAQPETKPEDLTRFITHANLIPIQQALVAAWVKSPESNGNGHA